MPETRAVLSQLHSELIAYAALTEHARFAHGDISSDNILVARNGTIVMVDYDGMYVDRLRGFSAEVVGQPDYQSPVRIRQKRIYEPWLDRFPLLVFDLSLRALMLQPDLLQYKTSGDGLLLGRSDFEAPFNSQLLSEIERLPDLAYATGLFRDACSASLDRVPTLADFNLARPAPRPQACQSHAGPQAQGQQQPQASPQPAFSFAMPGLGAAPAGSGLRPRPVSGTWLGLLWLDLQLAWPLRRARLRRATRPGILYIVLGISMLLLWQGLIGPAVVGEHPKIMPEPPPPRTTTTPYQQGLADREDWKNWFASTSGDYRSGAEFWAAQRSSLNPSPCDARSAAFDADVDAWVEGCQAAQQRLDGPDRRRRTEPEYRRGWNSPAETLGARGPHSREFQDGVTDRQSWENWFSGLTGDYRSGAEFWAGQRSLKDPSSCSAPSGISDPRAWTEGCYAAQQRLTPTDVRRHAEPLYRDGWNSIQKHAEIEGSSRVASWLTDRAGESQTRLEG